MYKIKTFTKILSGSKNDLETLDEKVNKFMENHNVIEIKTTQSRHNSNDRGQSRLVYTIIYSEK